jgi:hypothetical protein
LAVCLSTTAVRVKTVPTATLAVHRSTLSTRSSITINSDGHHEVTVAVTELLLKEDVYLFPVMVATCDLLRCMPTSCTHITCVAEPASSPAVVAALVR